MDRYRILGHMNAGAHGLILKATYANVADRSTSTANIADKYLLAIKRILIKNKTIPLTIVREIKCLQFLRSHDNIIQLEDVFALGSSVNLVFPLLPVNLTAIIYEMSITEEQKRLLIRMLLEGVRHCHTNGIIHRDLKPSNLLIDWNGVLKICDFGQARALPTNSLNFSEKSAQGKESQEETPVAEEAVLSHQVCTRWYRCPELLYGSNSYDYAVDMWSVGCIIGELLQRWPLFKGESDIEQLCLVVTALGTPPHQWVNTLPDFNKIQFTNQSNTELTKSVWFRKFQRKSGNDTIGTDLVAKLLTYTNRLTADQALRHPFVVHCVFKDQSLIKPDGVKHLVGPPNNRK